MERMSREDEIFEHRCRGPCKGTSMPTLVVEPFSEIS